MMMVGGRFHAPDGEETHLVPCECDFHTAGSLSFLSFQTSFSPHITNQSPRNRCHGLTLRHKMLTMAAGLLGAVHTSVTRSPT